MSVALINPEIIKWARERAGLSRDMLSNKAMTKDKIKKWEEGESKPTFKQAENLAKKLQIPFAYLYLSKPPKEELSVPDLRTVRDGIRSEFSINFKTLLNDIIYKHDWYIEYLKEAGTDPLSFVGKFTIQDSYNNIASDIKETLKIDELRKKSTSWTDFFKKLRSQAEECGILIFKNGITVTNAHKPLSVDEFRGFVIVNELAPLIFLNNKDAKAAQIFTLIHELAHIWLGKSGVSDLSLSMRNTENEIEIFCNKVAAEVLVPLEDFIHRWNQSADFEDNIAICSRIYKVSSIVIARRALEAGFISWNDFMDFYYEQVRLWNLKPDKKNDNGDYYNTQIDRLSLPFTQTVINSTFNGKTTFIEASKLLNIKHGNIYEFASRL